MAAAILTHARLRELLLYNPSTGEFTNLRDVEPHINAQNKHGATKTSKTRRLGVYPNGNGFMAQASAKGRALYLGTFKSADEAEAVALQARRQMYPGFTK